MVTLNTESCLNKEPKLKCFPKIRQNDLRLSSMFYHINGQGKSDASVRSKSSLYKNVEKINFSKY